jgi:senataxin
MADKKHNLALSFLDEAHVVFSTLSSSGMQSLEDCSPFQLLIVDEAAQAVELSTLVPLRLGCSQCVLVGDPQQVTDRLIRIFHFEIRRLLVGEGGGREVQD